MGIKVVVPSKDFAKKHYHDLSERPFFNGLCDFLSSGPVIAMVIRIAQLPYDIFSTKFTVYITCHIHLCAPSGLGR